MVWGRPAPPTSPDGGPPAAPPPVSPVRALVGLTAAGVLVLGLVAWGHLGPTWPVVAAAAAAVGAAVRLARAARRTALGAAALVAVAGIGWIELVDTVQYGTLSLSGPPALVRWCGTTYRTSGLTTTMPAVEGGPAYAPVLRTPSGEDVYGASAPRGERCGTSLPLFVAVGPARYLLYSSGTVPTPSQAPGAPSTTVPSPGARPARPR